jgi:hypothetical protein
MSDDGARQIKSGAESQTTAADEAWVDGASATDVHSRLTKLARDRGGGTVAVALATRPGTAIRLEARRRRAWLVVTGEMPVDSERSKKLLHPLGWRSAGSAYVRRSWRLPESGPVAVARDGLFADLAGSLAIASDEPIGGAISVRLETGQAEAAWRGSAGYAIGFAGWLLGTLGTLLSMILLARMGVDFPSWLADAAGPMSVGYDDRIPQGPLILAWFTSCAPAFAAASLVTWVADRTGARYKPAFLVAEVAAAAATAAYFAVLVLVGDMWGLAAAGTVLGGIAVTVIVIKRGPRRSA